MQHNIEHTEQILILAKVVENHEGIVRPYGVNVRPTRYRTRVVKSAATCALLRAALWTAELLLQARAREAGA